MSLTGQVKLCVHTMRLCQIAVGCDLDDRVDTVSLLDLLHLFKGHVVFNNEFLRYHLFCIFQILAGRSVAFTFIVCQIILTINHSHVDSNET